MLEGQGIAQARGAVSTVLMAAHSSLAAGCPPDHPSTAAGAELSPPIIVLDVDGLERCRIGGSPALRPGVKRWFEQVRGGAPYALGALPGGGMVIAAPDGADLVVAAFLPATWLKAAIAPDGAEPTAATWLIDGDGHLVASAGNVADALPQAEEFAALTTGRHSLTGGGSTAGHRYAYAAAPLGSNWRLLVALTAQPEHKRAVQVLFARSAELGLLLLGGLVAVVLGADVAFGVPLRRLSGAVRRWQAGAPFEPGSLVGAPDEVQQLARSFADATAVLRQKQEELARAEQQQQLLVMEVHHRVKNNLQVIASLLNLQASRIRVPEARAEFQSARDRIRALATLHRHLYGESGWHTINMRSFLTELCGQLFQAIGEPEGNRIQLLIDAPELRISSDEAVPLALIVTEAVTNSVKYAFPNGRSGKVSVSLTEEKRGAGEDWINLVISDDGVGIAPDRTNDIECDGIGLRLIRGFSRQLGATLSVEHDPGTRYTIRLPSRTTSLQAAARGAALPPLDVGMVAGESAMP